MDIVVDGHKEKLLHTFKRDSWKTHLVLFMSQMQLSNPKWIIL